MLEVYSNNVVVAADAAIPLNNVSLDKGESSKLQGVSTIQLNKCGIYEITMSATVTAGSAAAISIQLEKDGVLQPQAIVETTAADATSMYALGFTTLVQVNHNNMPNCPCSSPTNIEFINTGINATYNHINVTVVRV